jgi:hypothetical protein
MHMKVPVAERAAVSDDGHEIRLTLYDGAEALATVAPSPQRAVSLAGELLAAASRRFDAGFGSLIAVQRSGQRKSATIAKLGASDAAIRELRKRYFGALRITAAANEIALAGRRYETSAWRSDRSKSPADIADERSRLFAEALSGRSRFPGARQLRNIFGK